VTTVPHFTCIRKDVRQQTKKTSAGSQTGFFAYIELQYPGRSDIVDVVFKTTSCVLD
jgi:hypothetical protein